MRRHPRPVRLGRGGPDRGGRRMAARRGTVPVLALAAITKLADPASAPVLAISLVHGTAQAGLWEEEARDRRAPLQGERPPRPARPVLDVLVEALAYRDEDVSGRAEDFLLWLGQAAQAVTASLDTEHGAAPDRLDPWPDRRRRRPSSRSSRRSTTPTRALGPRRARPLVICAIRSPSTPLLDATRDADHAVRVKAAAALDQIGDGRPHRRAHRGGRARAAALGCRTARSANRRGAR